MSFKFFDVQSVLWPSVLHISSYSHQLQTLQTLLRRASNSLTCSVKVFQSRPPLKSSATHAASASKSSRHDQSCLCSVEPMETSCSGYTIDKWWWYNIIYGQSSVKLSKHGWKSLNEDCLSQPVQLGGNEYQNYQLFWGSTFVYAGERLFREFD